MIQERKRAGVLIRMDEATRERLKELAALRGKSMQRFIMDYIRKEVRRQKHVQKKPDEHE